jgi:hypothetical protein
MVFSAATEQTGSFGLSNAVSSDNESSKACPLWLFGTIPCEASDAFLARISREDQK